ncbi:MAG: hypothetical protein HY746_10110, partial [Elusimicrobia bacterium]|nr:hypothetical protein [Elusimicrobiota bacterium]
TSKAFQRFLNKYGIIGYPIRARAPWTNGRVERDHQEIQNWLIPVNKDINLKEMEKEVDEGMLMLNNIKPRAVLIYRTSAEVYFHSDGVEEVDRVLFAAELEGIKQRLWPLTGERLHRKAVRELLKKRLLYEEWDEANKEAKSANRIEAYNVSF